MQEKQSLTEQIKTGAERRRYTRVPISMKATYRGGGLEGKVCVIRDFCPGGFFLSWPNETVGKQILTLQDEITNQTFSVEFKVKRKSSGEKTYSIKFKVIRVFQGGMGVSFVEPEQSTIEILNKIAEASQKRREANKAKSIEEASLSGAHDETTVFNKSLLGQLNLNNNLDEILRSYFKKLDNKLIVLFKDAEDGDGKFDYFNSRELFKDNLNIPREEVLKAITAQLEGKAAQDWEKTFDESVDGNSLTLVDEKEFEAYLFITGIISDAEANNRLLLLRVGKKISDLFNIEFDDVLNPIGFSRLCRTIDSFLQFKEYGYESLKVAYQEMEKVLIPELIIFYEEISEGVEIKAESKPSEAFKSSSAPSSVGAEPASQLGQTTPSTLGQAGNSQPGQNFNQSHNFQQEPGFVSGTGTGFPTLDGAGPASQVTQNAGGIAQSLMALRQSVDAPEALGEMLRNQTTALDQSLAMPDSINGGIDNDLKAALQREKLLNHLDKIQSEDNLNWQNGATIADVTGRLLPMLAGAQQQVGEETQHALNLAGGVLNFLKDDEAISSPARQDLQRLQTVLYKQAVSEGGLFQERSNPLRNIVNLLEQVDRKGGNSEPETRKALDGLIDKLLSLESYDANNLENITENLDALLEQQSSVYQSRVESVVEQCDLEQTLLVDLRKSEDDSSVSNRANQATPTGEYKVWLDRAKAMQRGDSIVIDEPNGEKKHLSLAWTDPDQSQFVFVDEEGNKSSKMTQQELIVRLLKGSAELTDAEQKPLFDRAIISSLFGAYDDVKSQIINDPETGLLNEDKYREEVSLVLKNAIQDHVEHAFFYINYTIAENTINEEFFEYIKHTEVCIKDIFGEQSLVGRIGEKAVGITSEFLSREGALILAETLLKSLEDNECNVENERVVFPVSIGISVINDRSSDTEQVIQQALIASEQARERGENQSHLFEDDSEVTATNSAHDPIDWSFLLTDYSDGEEIIPLYGQHIFLSDSESDAKSAKPLFYIFPAIEDDESVLRKPHRFIKASNENELIIKFEKVFFTNCLDWMAANKKQISKNSRCLISLSGKTMNSKNILDFIIGKLTESSVPPGRICFEIPGSPLESNVDNVNRFIRTLREFGCRFSFGQNGNDSLSQEAMKLPVDYICIDESLTSAAVESAQSYGLIKSINDIAHMMEKQTIVPHTIGEQTMELLSEINIDYISSSEIEKPVRLNPVHEEGIQ